MARPPRTSALAYNYWRSVWQTPPAPVVEGSRAVSPTVKPTPSVPAKILSALAVAVLFEATLWLFLYLRPTPFGKPFALDPAHYVFHAIYYGAWAQTLIALPFLGWACLCKTAGRQAYGSQLVITSLLMLVGAVDRECQRFMGMHATRQWLETYASVDRTPDVVLNTLASDQGGAWSSLVGLALCLLYPFAAMHASPHLSFAWLGRRSAWCLAFGLVLLPAVLWNYVPGGKLRQAKVRPSLLTVLREVRSESRAKPDPVRLQKALAVYQAAQKRNDARGYWTFSNAEYPLRKHYVGPVAAPPAKRPNFIVVQLETFRAKDMKSTNEALAGAVTTPFLDSLARDQDGGYFTRYYASGVPTVHAFMSIHASLLSHPHKSIPAEGAALNIEGFPQLLGRAGYHTMHFTGSDPDWDSQRVWLDRWYDEVHFDPAHKERDRLVFRAASKRIREAAQGKEPFLAYLVSISNHSPFRIPEAQLAMGGGHTTIDFLHDTMHYTDDVVRELYVSLQNEPWFDDTIWIIMGDHGYDLGDRGEAGSHNNLRHETTWVPLIVHGKDSRLPRGKHTAVASHLDLAPTILELAFVDSDNSYMGSSLLARAEASSEAVVLRSGNYSYESADYSLYQPLDGTAFVYAGSDLTQEHTLDSVPASVTRRASSLAHAYETTLVHAIDQDRVVPRQEADETIAELVPEATL